MMSRKNKNVSKEPTVRFLLNDCIRLLRKSDVINVTKKKEPDFYRAMTFLVQKQGVTIYKLTACDSMLGYKYLLKCAGATYCPENVIQSCKMAVLHYLCDRKIEKDERKKIAQKNKKAAQKNLNCAVQTVHEALIR